MSNRILSALMCLLIGALAACGGGSTPANTVATPAVVLKSCQAITQSGHYTLDADIAAASDSAACISAKNLSDVHLDCAGHTLTGNAAFASQVIDFNTIQRFSIKNCVLHNIAAEGALFVKDSADGTISTNTFTYSGEANAQYASNFVNILSSQKINFSDNTLHGYYNQERSNSITVTRNKIFAFPKVEAPTVMTLYLNTHTTVTSNTLDGGSDGIRANENGADDGIIVQDESDVLIADNAISNIFDAGIETLGVVRSANMLRNHIVNAGFCGIGGWYYMSLISSTIAQNVVEKTPVIFIFMRADGLRAAGWDGKQAPADTGVYFQDNVFDGNSLIDIKATGAYSEVALFDQLKYVSGFNPNPTEPDPLPSQFFLTNNLFKNNNFGPNQPGPNFGLNPVVPGRVIDGGGNICTLISGPQNYPLVCH